MKSKFPIPNAAAYQRLNCGPEFADARYIEGTLSNISRDKARMVDFKAELDAVMMAAMTIDMDARGNDRHGRHFSEQRSELVMYPVPVFMCDNLIYIISGYDKALMLSIGNSEDVPIIHEELLPVGIEQVEGCIHATYAELETTDFIDALANYFRLATIGAFDSRVESLQGLKCTFDSNKNVLVTSHNRERYQFKVTSIGNVVTVSLGKVVQPEHPDVHIREALKYVTEVFNCNAKFFHNKNTIWTKRLTEKVFEVGEGIELISNTDHWNVGQSPKSKKSSKEKQDK